MNTLYVLTPEQLDVIRKLAADVASLKPKTIKKETRNLAEITVLFTREEPRKLNQGNGSLHPGEVCLWCGSIGARKVKKSTKPECPTCHKPFTRDTPWRLVRGKRIHVACYKS